MQGVADGEAGTAESSDAQDGRGLNFTSSGLADAWGLATRSVVQARELRHDAPGGDDDGADATDQEHDEDASADNPSATFAEPLRPLLRHTPPPIEAAPEPLDRRAITLVVGFVALALLAVGAGIGFRWLGSRKNAPASPPSLSQSDPDASIVQVRCEALDNSGFFIGSLTNRAKEPLRFRVDVTFAARDGQEVGHGSTQVDYVVPQGTSSLDISAGVTGEVASCRTIATRLSRDG